MYYKVYEARHGLMIAVADEDIIGKKFKFKDTEFFVNPLFYKGIKANKERIVEVLKDASSANIVGKKSVEAGIEAGVIDKTSVIMIAKNVPHAQFMFMDM